MNVKIIINEEKKFILILGVPVSTAHLSHKIFSFHILRLENSDSVEQTTKYWGTKIQAVDATVSHLP